MSNWISEHEPPAPRPHRVQPDSQRVQPPHLPGPSFTSSVFDGVNADDSKTEFQITLKGVCGNTKQAKQNLRDAIREALEEADGVEIGSMIMVTDKAAKT